MGHVMEVPKTIADSLIAGWDDRAGIAILDIGPELVELYPAIRAEIKTRFGEDVSATALGFLFGSAFALGYGLGEAVGLAT